ncbi:MAG: DUF4835 family protein [Bacteroidia bacterium]|nr:DUF4835 family protein [Bacteroidia bacterium]
MKQSLILSLLLTGMLTFGPARLAAQELLVNVTVDASRIVSDKSVFDDLQQAISRYLNFQQWSTDKFEGSERIRANMTIIVQSRPAPDQFVCQLNLQVYRPVYNTTYETMLFNHSDKKFNFTYVQFQPLQFVENTFTDNLTSLLNYYAYIMLALDYDSFSPSGGAPYVRKAQEILNLAVSSALESGWRANEDNQNRYWLVENMQNSRYRSFHEAMYKYHRQGLDMMESTPAQGRRAITAALKDIERLHQQDPILMITRAFLNAKEDELVKVYQAAFINDKKEFLQIMQEIDPANIGTYEKVNESN